MKICVFSFTKEDNFTPIDNIMDIPDITQYDKFILGGGEPTLQPFKIVYLATELKQFNKPISLFTNGILLKNKMMRCYLDGFVDEIKVFHTNKLTVDDLYTIKHNYKQATISLLDQPNFEDCDKFSLEIK